MTDKKNFTVMQILPALQSGGVERGTIDIAKALKNSDIEPIVVSSGGILVYQLREAGIKHIELPVNKKNPWVIFKNIQKIADLITKYKVDVVHVRSRAPMWSAYFACKKTKAKLVSTVHGTYSLKFLFWSNFLPKRLYNAIMLKADRVIVVSNFIKDYIAKNYQDKKNPKFLQDILDKTTVIQRGADLNSFNSAKISKSRIVDLIKLWRLPEDKKIIFMPARFTSWKGHEFLIDALAKVKGDFCCVMAGSDHGHEKFRKKIETKIIKSNLAGKVKLVGVCKEMSLAYAMSYLVICPSVRPEAFGRIAIEAQASSRMIIATKIGGSLETVIDGKTGFLVDVNDSDKLAQMIDEVLNFSQDQVAEIEQAARKNIEENFSNDMMCAKTIAVYKEFKNSQKI